MRRFLPSFCPAAIFILAGCASAGPRIPAECRSDLRRSARPMEEVVDSAGMLAMLEEIWTPSTGRVLATVRYDSVGARDTVIVYSRSISDDVRVRLLGSLMGLATEEGARGSEVHLILGDASGPNPRRVDRFVGCRPEIINSERLTRDVGQIGRDLGISRTLRVVILAFVEVDGSVGEIRIQESSGHLDFDREVLRRFRSTLFRPAMLEGIPLPVWAAFPVTARSGGR